MAQAVAVDRLRLAGIGGSELGDGDVVVATDHAGHAGRPQQLVAHVGVDEAVHVGQLVQRRLGARMHAGDEFQLGFAEVHRDVWMRQRRSQFGGVTAPCQDAGGRHPQALLFDAAPQCTEFGATADRRQGRIREFSHLEARLDAVRRR